MGGQPLFEQVNLFVGTEQKGNTQDTEIRNNGADAGHGKSAAVELADLHLAVHGQVIAHDAAGINLEFHFAVRLLPHLLGKFPEPLDPDTPFRGKRCHLEQILLAGHAGRRGAQQRNGQYQNLHEPE